MTLPKFGMIEATVKATIRLCTEADLPSLEWMGLYTRDRGVIRQAFQAQQRGEALMLLAVARGFPIAQVWIDLVAKRRERVAVLWAIRTFFPLQRVGIGSRMVRAAENAVRNRGYVRAELEVEEVNGAVIAFYRQLGWRVAGKDGGFWTMSKEINGI